MLSDRDILYEYNKKNIIISPFRRKALTENSYDVRLGEYYFREKKRLDFNGQDYLNPWDPATIDNYWGQEHRATLVTSEHNPYNLKLGDRYIELEPGESILGHTIEFIGGRNYIVSQMQGRSSINRCRISVCDDAGVGGIGYIDRWTMEIQNKSKTKIILIVGERIAKIVFVYSNYPLKKGYQGVYQSKQFVNNKRIDIAALHRNWSPRTMKPRLKRDV